METVIKLSYQGKADKRTYIIYKYDGQGALGAMWSILEKGTLNEMMKSLNSYKYSNCKKIFELHKDDK